MRKLLIILFLMFTLVASANEEECTHENYTGWFISSVQFFDDNIAVAHFFVYCPDCGLYNTDSTEISHEDAHELGCSGDRVEEKE